MLKARKDRIVLVMGPTGAGKSTFIHYATSTCEDIKTVGHSWQSCTAEIQTVRVTHPIDGHPVIFVDTPGFDNTFKSDAEILTMIADWLINFSEGDVNVTAILYLHRISDNRMSNSAMKNLQIFSKLCGQKAMPNVIIITTMWSKVEMKTGVRRERELRGQIWKDMLRAGCRTERFEDSRDSAWGVIGDLVKKSGMQVKLSKMADSRPGLKETQAGIASQDLEQKDRIVLVMGPTGSGKSTFINYATGQDAKTVGHSWQSCTTEIRSVRVTHPTEGHPVVFVDTPGFDDTHKSDIEILTTITDWLVKVYERNVKLATILYFHRISDNRMSRSAMKNLQIFWNLCGRKAMPHVVIVTTMWGFIPEALGISREEVLNREVWKGMLGEGYSVQRFGATYDSAWKIVESLTKKDSGVTLLIQEEMCSIRKPLKGTKAGIDLNTETEMGLLESLLSKIRRVLLR